MESIYFVATWLCHRSCPHCYEERFHPYYGGDLQRVVEQSRRNVPRILDHFPAPFTYTDAGIEKPGRVILAGGEILLEAVREPVLYPALEQLRARYAGQGGIRPIVQTTGDIVTARIVGELIERGVWMISVSGMDAYHEGFEEQATRDRLADKLRGWFEAAGMRHCDSSGSAWQDPAARGPYYHFFGATPEAWIGKLWPRGRAHANELSTATLADNFCSQWSGGLNFRNHGLRGSEVSVDPEGNVYPCCLKTKAPIGNLLEMPLETILDRLAGHPAYEALNAGQPQRMGLAYGWSEETFRQTSRTLLPSGRVYENLCIGCDRFHEEVLIPLQK